MGWMQGRKVSAGEEQRAWTCKGRWGAGKVALGAPRPLYSFLCRLLPIRPPQLYNHPHPASGSGLPRLSVGGGSQVGGIHVAQLWLGCAVRARTASRQLPSKPRSRQRAVHYSSSLSRSLCKLFSRLLAGPRSLQGSCLRNCFDGPFELVPNIIFALELS